MPQRRHITNAVALATLSVTVMLSACASNTVPPPQETQSTPQSEAKSPYSAQYTCSSQGKAVTLDSLSAVWADSSITPGSCSVQITGNTPNDAEKAVLDFAKDDGTKGQSILADAYNVCTYPLESHKNSEAVPERILTALSLCPEHPEYDEIVTFYTNPPSVEDQTLLLYKTMYGEDRGPAMYELSNLFPDFSEEQLTNLATVLCGGLLDAQGSPVQDLEVANLVTSVTSEGKTLEEARAVLTHVSTFGCPEQQNLIDSFTWE